MRLICPNCDAQYNVADDAIPPGGRDVQCSNCQVSWFQTEKPTVPGRERAQLILPQQEDTNEKTAISEETPEPPTEEAASAPEPEVAEADPEPAPEPVPQFQRRPLDDAVANILREEAAVSNTATAESPTPEPKPEMPSAAPDMPSAAPAVAPAVAASVIAKPPATEAARAPKSVSADETRQRIAQMTADEGGTRTGAQKQAAPAAAAKTATSDEAHQRTVPSMNEINATLRARAQANDTSGLTEAEKEQAVQRKGFRRGFFWILMLFAILTLPYIFADQITEALPQTSGAMASYVMMVDQLRVALSDMVSGLTSE